MNATLMEELLNEDESSTLDFKRDQYLFDKTTDDLQKGKLLKDILAFANSWRRTDAYILIGVEDVKGGRSNVVGVTWHFDDANLQQFVNSKTNRPVTFAYKVFPYEGMKIGIIHIPLQDRPIYLTKDFGGLRKSEVYIRRNSSTDIATPDEIIKIGNLKIREVLGEVASEPKLNPVIEALRRAKEEEVVVLAQVIQHRAHIWRMKCKITEVNDLYAVFQSVGPEGIVSGAISQITVSYEPTMNMEMFTIAPIV